MEQENTNNPVNDQSIIENISSDKLLMECSKFCKLNIDYGHSINLLCWNKSKKFTGHVALEIISGHTYAYISYWPAEDTCFQSVPGMFCIKNSDRQREQVEPIIINLSDLKLDIEKIINKYEEIKNHKNNQWSLLHECCSCFDKKDANFHGNCSTLVMFLLEEGGLKGHLPSNGRFGGLRHILLLCCSRVCITTSFLACGIYPVIEDNIGDDEHSGIALIGTVLMVVLNGVFVFLIEKKLAPRGFIEINYKDCFVGISASLGFGLVALFDKWIERVGFFQIIENNIVTKTIFDFILLAIGTLLGLYVFGKLASVLISLISLKPFQGTSFTFSPQNIAGWKKYIEAANNCEVKKFVSKAEYFSISILYTSWIACYVVRSLGFIKNELDEWFSSGIFAFYIGIPIGMGISYIFIKYYLVKLQNELKSTSNLNIDEIQYAITEQHGQSLERYLLTTLTTAFGILTGVYLCSRVDMLNGPFITALIASVIGALGFCAGAGLYKSAEMLSNLCKKNNVCQSRNENYARLFNNNLDDGNSSPPLNFGRM